MMKSRTTRIIGRDRIIAVEKVHCGCLEESLPLITIQFMHSAWVYDCFMFGTLGSVKDMSRILQEYISWAVFNH